jgi:hypothetical protein
MMMDASLSRSPAPTRSGRQIEMKRETAQPQPAHNVIQEQTDA